MKKNIFTTLTIIMFFQLATAQKASDVLENGIPLKTNEKLFISFENESKELKFDAAKSIQDPSNPPDFITLKDSTIFLASKGGVNVYLRPLNPLNFSYSTENKIIIDQISADEVAALSTIIAVINTVIPVNKAKPLAPKGTPPGILNPKPPVDVDCDIKKLQETVESIQKKLSDNKKATINGIFKKLKSLDFIDKDDTKSQLATIKISIDEVEDYFNKIEASIIDGKKMVEDYKCDSPDKKFTIQYIFNDILKDFSTTKNEQKKRLDNIQRIYEEVDKEQRVAAIGGGSDGLRWCVKPKELPSKVGEISVYTITVKESGYNLSDKEEIVSLEPKDILKKTVRIRQFQRFIPEVSVGVAYTFLKYYSYGTTSDSTGQQYVASPTENTVKNINITTMLNYNYYIPNSNIHPLYQIGVGINSGMPTLLTGFGIRTNANGIKRLAISGGIAMTWLRELETLKVGDKVTGTADIEDDYKYSSAPKFSPYICLQYNF